MIDSLPTACLTTNQPTNQSVNNNQSIRTRSHLEPLAGNGRAVQPLASTQMFCLWSKSLEASPILSCKSGLAPPGPVDYHRKHHALQVGKPLRIHMPLYPVRVTGVYGSVVPRTEACVRSLCLLLVLACIVAHAWSAATTFLLKGGCADVPDGQDGQDGST